MSDNVARHDDEDDRAWMTVPEAGAFLAGLGRSASYLAAQRGELPVLKIGRRLVVPRARVRALAGLPPEPCRD